MDDILRQKLISIQGRLLDMALEIDRILCPELLESEEADDKITLPAGPPDPEDGV